MHKRLKVIMIVGGFPNPEQPFKCIFNLRAVKQLSQYVDIEVISLRACYFGRKRIQRTEVEGIPVYTITAPQVPGLPLLNLALYQYSAWPVVRPIIENCNLVHSVYADGPGILSSLWAKRAYKRHILQIIGSDINVTIQNHITIRKFGSWYNHVHGVIANSIFLAKLFKELYSNVRNIQAIYRGTDLDKFNIDVTPDGPMVNKAPVRFLYLGGFPYAGRIRKMLHVEKGGQYLLEAWRNAENDLSQSKGALMLAGPNSDSQEQKKLRDSLKHPDLVYLDGPIGPEKVPNYMCAADVVVLPSLAEGLPNVAQEAMACGKAIIGSSVGGLPELVDDGETGYLVPPKDVTALSKALIDAARNPERIKRMGIKARQKAVNLLDHRTFASKVVDLYETVLKEPLKNN